MTLKNIALFIAFSGLLTTSAFAEESCSTDFHSSDVVYVGDSISLPPYNYSKSVAEALQTKTSKVARFAVGGSAAKNWLNHFRGMNAARIGTATLCGNGDREQSVHVGIIPPIEDVFARKPKAAVIALGTNDVADFCIAVTQSGLASAKRQVLKGDTQLAQSAKAASGGHCVWLMPIPYTKGAYANDCSSLENGSAHGFAAGIGYLKEAVENSCTVVTTSGCPIPEHYDGLGVHPSSREGKTLGACMGAKVKAALANSPQSSSSHGSSQ